MRGTVLKEPMKLFTQFALCFCTATLILLAMVIMQLDGRVDYVESISVMSVVTAAIFIWVYRTFIKPLDELKDAAGKIKEGDLDFSLQNDSNSEMGELIRSFEEMRARLLASQIKQAQSDNEERELIRNIAHDLKTPITTIKGYSEGLMDGIAASPEKQQKYLRTIHQKASDMTNLIDELSYYSMVDSNRIPYTFRKLPVLEYFNGIADALYEELPEKNIEFSYEAQVPEDARMLADSEQLNRVITNIISNSVKYMDKTPGKISMTVTDRGDYIRCDIGDNGIGVSPENLPKLYDRFYRTDQARGSAKGGSGIGLSIVKKVIQDHGGFVWATGEPGKGLTQHFELRKINEQKDTDN